jgi:CRISPR-associated protein Cmr6
MNKGTIQITSTRKGFAGTLRYTNPKGQEKSIPIIGVKFTSDQYQGECQYEFDGSKLIKLIAHDGTVLVDVQPTPAAVQAPGGLPGNAGKRLSVPKMAPTDDIFNIEYTYLPKEFHDETLRLHNIDNFSLKLNKAAYYEVERDKAKFYFYKQNRRGNSRFVQPNFGNLPFDRIASRHLANAKQLFPNEENLITSHFYPDWRMVIGLGGESVFETSITLHHVYGIPYIPASSIKGVVRGWIITNVFLSQIPEGTAKRGEKAEDKALLENPTFKKWFGSQDSAGKLTFFDAFPLSRPHILPDVMNPHYQDYYSDSKGQKGPTDFQRTNPIPFLTVSGCMFQFLIGTDETALLKSEMIGGRSIEDWLHSALQNHGIGAKTAVGYGYFREAGGS